MGTVNLRAAQESKTQTGGAGSELNNHTLIIGAGFAGLAMAYRFRQGGNDDFTILEQGSDVGGTWRDNHYPGAECDIASPLYSFSFAPNPTWSKMYAPQAEIFAYMRAFAATHQLERNLCRNCSVSGFRFDEASGLWTVTAADGSEFTARFLVTGTGGLSRPMLPKIPGIDNFQGKLLHSARWDHSYPFAGKNVGIIGTGASSIQLVPQLAAVAKNLRVFQRSPAWVMPKADRLFSPAEQALFRRFPLTQKLVRAAIYWRCEGRVLGMKHPFLLKLFGRRVARHLKRQIKDPALLAKLKPNYTLGCKRILLSSDYYPALTRANVDVVTAPIARITKNGLVTGGGVEYPLDALVCATGFYAADDCAAVPVIGSRGQDLSELWRDGAEAYRGVAVSGFPNLFMIVGPNSGLGHNSMILMIEAQAKYIFSAISSSVKAGMRYVEVRPEVQADYNRAMHARLNKMVWATGGCKSWYLAANGKNTTLYPGTTFGFMRQMRQFDAANYTQVALGQPAEARRY